MEPTPNILDRIALLIIKSVLRRGFSSITVSLGGMEASAKAAKVSIIRFTHNICVTVSGSSVPITEPNKTMSSATKLIVSWKTMKRWIFLYRERPRGRSLYKNIQRFIVFQLTINFVALLIVLLGSVIGTELPLTVTQMLWVNLIMDTFAALALASIPPSETVMLEKPRRSTDFIISKAMRSNILGVGSIFLIVLLGMIYYFDHSTEGMDIHNLTIFFTFFVMLQFWNLFNARVFGTTDSAFKGLSKSYGMELIVLAILAGQFLIVQFGGAVFRTEPLNWQTWLLIIGVSSTVLWVGELIRLVQRIIHKKNRNEK